jgi:hypothetical protein
MNSVAIVHLISVKWNCFFALPTSCDIIRFQKKTIVESIHMYVAVVASVHVLYLK